MNIMSTNADKNILNIKKMIDRKVHDIYSSVALDTMLKMLPEKIGPFKKNKVKSEAIPSGFFRVCYNSVAFPYEIDIVGFPDVDHFSILFISTADDTADPIWETTTDPNVNAIVKTCHESFKEVMEKQLCQGLGV